LMAQRRIFFQDRGNAVTALTAYLLQQMNTSDGE
jgi:hypothetical protein